MSMDIIQLDSALQEAVYRRRHLKADGRELFLYGYTRPDYEALSEPEGERIYGGELRRHPLRQDWSIYAAARQNRTYKPSSANDPLAPSAVGKPATEIPFETFELAVFDNRFPGMHPDTSAPQSQIALLNKDTANGKCEVIVYAPEQTGSLALLSQSQRSLLVQAWIDRYQAHFAAGQKFVLPFENRGDEVGVTLHHPHGQIYAFPFVPAVQQKAVDAFEGGYDLAKGIRDWTEDYSICTQGGVAAFAPPFARYPYEVWVAPIERQPGPWAFSREQLEGFAALLGDVTRRYDAFFGRSCPYMLSLQASPVGFDSSFHFTAQFYPILRSQDRLKYFACVEHATNVFTVDVMPEETARVLRKL
ncbi:MAG: hypothetical protein MRY72_08370 [Aquisalinus sp.]|nr:hypothetical protein [Aquisalinus sp.]